MGIHHTILQAFEYMYKPPKSFFNEFKPRPPSPKKSPFNTIKGKHGWAPQVDGFHLSLNLNQQLTTPYAGFTHVLWTCP
jgi:hypothetical protein